MDAPHFPSLHFFLLEVGNAREQSFFNSATGRADYTKRNRWRRQSSPSSPPPSSPPRRYTADPNADARSGTHANTSANPGPEPNAAACLINGAVSKSSSPRMSVSDSWGHAFH